MTHGGAPRRRAEVWALSWLYLGGAAGLALGAAVPFSPQAPVVVGRGLAVLGALVGVAVLAGGHRLGQRGLNVLLALATLLMSAVVYLARTPAGAVLDGYAYFWVAAYAGHFLSRRAALGHAAVVAAGFGLALLPDRGFNALAVWLIVSTSVTALILVWGHLVRQLTAQARRDHLTGLLNRAGLREAARDVLRGGRRQEGPVTVVVADLDGFKQVNDREGHAAGDALLQETAQAWSAALRRGDLLGREGGDEFVFVLPATTEIEAVALVERLGEVSPTAWSAGVATWRPGEDLHHCVDRADAALYQAKAARRQRPEQLAGSVVVAAASPRQAA